MLLHKIPSLFPWKHNKTKIMAEPVLEEDANLEQQLEPCEICGRTFLPISLTKHNKICERNAVRKRKIFNSLKQRVAGTDLAPFHQKTYLKKEVVAKVSEPAMQATWQEKHQQLVSAIRAAKSATEVSQPRVTHKQRTMATINKDAERCPSCDRQFGPKAFDRHVEWCKERAARLPQSPASVQQAKERLEARIKYRVPPMNKPKRTVREKYQSPHPSKSEVVGSTGSSCNLERRASIRKTTPSSVTLNKRSDSKPGTPAMTRSERSSVDLTKTKKSEPVKSSSKRFTKQTTKLNTTQINDQLTSLTVANINTPLLAPKKLVTWRDVIKRTTTTEEQITSLPPIIDKTMCKTPATTTKGNDLLEACTNKTIKSMSCLTPIVEKPRKRLISPLTNLKNVRNNTEVNTERSKCSTNSPKSPKEYANIKAKVNSHRANASFQSSTPKVSPRIIHSSNAQSLPNVISPELTPRSASSNKSTFSIPAHVIRTGSSSKPLIGKGTKVLSPIKTASKKQNENKVTPIITFTNKINKSAGHQLNDAILLDDVSPAENLVTSISDQLFSITTKREVPFSATESMKNYEMFIDELNIDLNAYYPHETVIDSIERDALNSSTIESRNDSGNENRTKNMSETTSCDLIPIKLKTSNEKHLIIDNALDLSFHTLNDHNIDKVIYMKSPNSNSTESETGIFCDVYLATLNKARLAREMRSCCSDVALHQLSNDCVHYTSNSETNLSKFSRLEYAMRVNGNGQKDKILEIAGDEFLSAIKSPKIYLHENDSYEMSCSKRRKIDVENEINLHDNKKALREHVNKIRKRRQQLCNYKKTQQATLVGNTNATSHIEKESLATIQSNEKRRIATSVKVFGKLDDHSDKKSSCTTLNLSSKSSLDNLSPRFLNLLDLILYDPWRKPMIKLTRQDCKNLLLLNPKMLGKVEEKLGTNKENNLMPLMLKKKDQLSNCSDDTYNPFITAERQLMELLECDDFKPYKSSTPSKTPSATIKSTKAPPPPPTRQNAKQKTNQKNQKNTRASVIDPPIDFKDDSDIYDENFELIENFINDNYNNDDILNNFDFDSISLTSIKSTNRTSSSTAHNNQHDVDSFKSFCDELAIDPRLINEYDNLSIPEHLTIDDNTSPIDILPQISNKLFNNTTDTTTTTTNKSNSDFTAHTEKNKTKNVAKSSHTANNNKQTMNSSSFVRSPSPHEKRKNLSSLKSKIILDPVKPKNMKNKEDVENYFHEQEIKKSPKSVLKVEPVPIEDDLFPIDDEMYEEYKKYEQMYLQDREEKLRLERSKGISEDDSAGTKISGDSAYGSLSRQQRPKVRTKVAKLSPLEPHCIDSASSSGSEASPSHDCCQAQTQSAPHNNSNKTTKFCHECGNKYPLTTAKFCVECGVKRLPTKGK